MMDSLILCKFLRGVFTEPFAEGAALLAAVTGWPVDRSRAAATARRIVLAKSCFNIREGWQPPRTGCLSGCCPSRCASAGAGWPR